MKKRKLTICIAVCLMVISVLSAGCSNSSDTVSFYETGANRYVASVNGTSVGHVHKANINKAVKQIADVAANKQVDSVF